MSWKCLQFSIFHNLPKIVRSTTDTVISVEEDPEIEALSKEPLAPPNGSTHQPTPQHYDRTHIDLELGHDIPGLVTPSDPEVCNIYLSHCVWVIQFDNGADGNYMGHPHT